MPIRLQAVGWHYHFKVVVYIKGELERKEIIAFYLYCYVNTPFLKFCQQNRKSYSQYLHRGLKGERAQAFWPAETKQ